MTTLTIGDGERFNALGRAQWRALEEAASSPEVMASTAAVVIRGRGKSFCSGSDLREFVDASADDVRAAFIEIEAALGAVEDIPVPTVAVIEGVAAGGGCQLALACDLQLMESSARIGMPTSQLGILVSATFATRMSLRIGPSRTKELLYSGRLVAAPEARDMGLVTTVAPATAIDNVLAELLEGWGRQSAASLRAAKAAVNLGLAPVSQPARDRVMGETADPSDLPKRLASFLHRTGKAGK
ncbi:MAG TPA: enoyl-CoA hydratase/isomerase family protein [Micrococcaceae bacterium]|nr:enoyl-CoA hydratase/isomerase family protein [Micrococcaceae bacterium]